MPPPMIAMSGVGATATFLLVDGDLCGRIPVAPLKAKARDDGEGCGGGRGPRSRPPPRKRSGRLLDRAELPGIGANRASERPVLLELHRLGPAAVEDLRAALVGRIVDEARQEVDGCE